MSLVKISCLCLQTVLSMRWLFEFLFFSYLVPSLLPPPTLYTLHMARSAAQGHLNNVAWSHLSCFTSTWKSGDYILYYFIYDHTNSSINHIQTFVTRKKWADTTLKILRFCPKQKPSGWLTIIHQAGCFDLSHCWWNPPEEENMPTASQMCVNDRFSLPQTLTNCRWQIVLPFKKWIYFSVC